MSGWWRQNLWAAPGLGISVLPKLACPACWPAYAGVLSSVGLGFLIRTEFLIPLTAAFLILALGALAFRANRRHGYGPLFFGLASTSGILVGKFGWGSNPILYVAVGLLVAASLWNSWPRSPVRSEASIDTEFLE